MDRAQKFKVRGNLENGLLQSLNFIYFKYLYTQYRAETHDPKIKSYRLY